MDSNTILFVLLILGGAIALSWPLGRYLKWAMDPEAPVATTRLFQTVGGAVTRRDQDWKRYIIAMLAFNAISFTVTYAILALQQYLPLNPDAKEALSGDMIFNTA